MEKKKNARQTSKNNLVIKDEENISTIREILFGNKIADFERRFEAFEKHVNQEIASIREEVERMYKTLESFIKSEQKSLLDSFKEEQKERLEGEKRIREDIDALSKKLVSHKEETANTHRDIRQLLLDQHKKLSDDFRHLKQEFQSALETRVHALEDKKVNRLALADLLTEIALQLSKEPPQPTGDKN